MPLDGSSFVSQTYGFILFSDINRYKTIGTALFELHTLASRPTKLLAVSDNLAGEAILKKAQR
jgi:hypothetical protein